MAEASHLCGFFSYEGDDASLGVRWSTWLDRFKLYIQTKKLVDEKDIKPLFLLLMGVEAYSIYHQLKKSDDSDKMDEIYKFMDKHFNPARSQFAERCAFRQMKRHDNESVNSFAIRLRKAAQHCKFGQVHDDQILEQFVVGCHLEEFQRACIRKDDLTLDVAIDIAKGFADTESNLQTLLNRNSTANEINHMRQVERAKSSKIGSSKADKLTHTHMCSACGKERHLDRSQCPARGKTCIKCGKLNHFASVCRSAAKQGVDGSKFGKASSRAKPIHLLETNNEAKSYQVEESEYADFLKYKEAAKSDLFRISQNPRNDGPRVEVVLFDAPISFLIDTGSPVNVIDERAYEKLKSKPALKPCNTLYYGFKSNTPLATRGQFGAKLVHNNKSENTTFIVVEGESECLLSYATAKSLGFLKFILQVKHSTCSDVVNSFKSKFPNLFSGKLGCVKEVEIKLEIDPSVKPVRQPQRPIAIHLREAVERELERPQEADVLERVDSNHGPTSWVSNLVIVPKDKPVQSVASITSTKTSSSQLPEVRLTCDSRALNKAIKRTRYPTKTSSTS